MINVLDCNSKQPDDPYKQHMIGIDIRSINRSVSMSPSAAEHGTRQGKETRIHQYSSLLCFTNNPWCISISGTFSGVETEF